jgi:hypothetical protein
MLSQVSRAASSVSGFKGGRRGFVQFVCRGLLAPRLVRRTAVLGVEVILARKASTARGSASHDVSKLSRQMMQDDPSRKARIFVVGAIPFSKVIPKTLKISRTRASTLVAASQETKKRRFRN